MLLTENQDFIDYWCTNDLVDCGMIDHKNSKNICIINDIDDYNQEKLNNKNNLNNSIKYNELHTGDSKSNTRNTNISNAKYRNRSIDYNSNRSKTNSIRINHLSETNTNKSISNRSNRDKNKESVLLMSSASTISNYKYRKPKPNDTEPKCTGSKYNESKCNEPKCNESKCSGAKWDKSKLILLDSYSKNDPFIKI